MPSSSFYQAKRMHGVCKGSLYRQIEKRPGVASSSSSKVLSFAILFGVQLVCYDSKQAYDDGDRPMTMYLVVALSSSGNDAFRLVTHQGTHLLCRAMTNQCREVWLSAITAGLERSLAEGQNTVEMETFSKVKPRSHNKRNLKHQPYCHSCGKMERLEFQLIKEGTPILQYGEEERVDISENCFVAQGVVDHVSFVREMYRYQELDQYAIQQARYMVLKKLKPELEIDHDNPKPLTSQLQLTKTSPSEVAQLFIRPDFKALQRASSTLHDLATEFEQGIIGVLELLELMEQSLGIRDKEMAALKKQAFRMAGDMGTSLKMLAEQALPTEQYTSTELLQCILDFLLDLCDDGEIQTIAFYWPQLCNIHLQMLPPTDVASLQRIELMEDFLLTMAAKHSVHLAIELIWSHTADLEDAKTLKYCRNRKFAVIRFLCELESMLFDFESGWGGGSVTVGGYLNPTKHQIMLLKNWMAEIQKYRLTQTEVLSRSCRLDKLRGRQSMDEAKVGPEKLAEEALRIARNADYLSSHMAFTKRLCDIAEKLFHQPVPERAAMLQNELFRLNSSGAMGGDPLNTVKESHTRVVRIPPTEGHVFRSKERTPVLLLVEVNDEGVTESAVDTLNQQFKSEKLKQEKRNQQEDENHLKEVNANGGEPTAAASSESGENDDSADVEQQSEIQPQSESASEPVKGASAPQEAATAVTDVPLAPESPHPSILSSPIPNTPGGTLVEDPGSTEGLHHEPEQRHALRRFDGKNGAARILTPTAEKEMVEGLVTQAVVNKLIIPSLADGKEDEAEMNGSEGMNGNGEDRSLAPALKRISSMGNATSPREQDLRREVLNSIMMKGMSKSNTIAAGATGAVQRHLQQLDQRLAVELLMTGDAPISSSSDSARHELLSLGISSVAQDEQPELTAEAKEENDTMEAIRLLLIQYHVAQGTLSMQDAAKALTPNMRRKGDLGTRTFMGREFPEIDAGDIDQRLVGCGVLPPAVLQALSLWKGGMITNGELLELVKKDLEYVKVSEESQQILNEDSAFWQRFAFGERWAEKRSRIAANSHEAAKPGYDLIGVIVKSNDDLRQEAFVMQLIELCKEAFHEAGLDLWLLPYRILPTGRTTGVIEMVRNAMSFDALKKRPGYGKGGLKEHLRRMSQFAADPGEAFKSFQNNFVKSLAAYSLLSYLFLFKDRHNGNLLLDTVGHVIHIDFGFVFGIAPGGNFSLELNTPFKLTEEMIDVMDGVRSSLFSEFVTLFCCGFLALQAHTNTFVTLLEITSKGSTFHAFEGKNCDEIIAKFKQRLCAGKNKEETISTILDVIKEATSSYGTKQYDYFQYMSQGIAQ
ncbi:unnamed protein product [Cylindrotheca closterium]|uniref:PI3K/PI4K catalytic domain-containing protein n=1 Tax=Cylindrotheca closterium TaxID=2856 RepID=A0AAD2CWZ3_9STRA|nr:unnamed protein product [Cylindrotheca closterium]